MSHQNDDRSPDLKDQVGGGGQFVATATRTTDPTGTGARNDVSEYSSNNDDGPTYKDQVSGRSSVPYPSAASRGAAPAPAASGKDLPKGKTSHDDGPTYKDQVSGRSRVPYPSATSPASAPALTPAVSGIDLPTGKKQQQGDGSADLNTKQQFQNRVTGNQGQPGVEVIRRESSALLLSANVVDEEAEFERYKERQARLEGKKEVVHATPVPPESRRRPRSILWGTLACLVLVVVGLGFGLSLALRPSPPPPVSPPPTVVESQPPVTTSLPTTPPTGKPSLPERFWNTIESIRDDRDVEFGFSVDMSASGNYVAVGAVKGGQNSTGYARIFKFNATAAAGAPEESLWQPVGQDIPGQAVGDRFGSTVLLSDDGSIVAVANPSFVSFFTYNNSTQSWEFRDGGPNVLENLSFFGGGMAMTGDGRGLAMVTWTGSLSTVRVFEFVDGTGWLEGDSFYRGVDFDGQSVAISSGTEVGAFVVAIGDSGSFLGSTSRGTIRIFAFLPSEERWTQVGNTIEGSTEFDYFGEAIVLSADGSRVAIGSGQSDPNGIDNAGYVAVFTHDKESNQWLQIGNRIVGDEEGDSFGMTISLSANGSRLLIGSQFNNGVDEKGYVRAFQYNDVDDVWIQLGGDLVGEVEREEFGFALAMSAEGNRIVISAPDQSQDSEGTGYIAVYDLMDA